LQATIPTEKNAAAQNNGWRAEIWFLAATRAEIFPTGTAPDTLVIAEAKQSGSLSRQLKYAFDVESLGK
jgi:hypothetical protein